MTTLGKRMGNAREHPKRLWVRFAIDVNRPYKQHATVQFLLLGRFDVVVNGGALALGGRRQRSVLAVLAVNANHMVSFDRLVDDVWGDQPPATAIPTMQRYISHLRRALASSSATIETRRPGYVLCVEPDAIDARRFERLVEEGRKHLASGAAEEAASVLREGLSLWRGSPLADFRDEPFARIECTRLEELRSRALELRIEADLAAGRHHDLVAELEALVAAYPLRDSYRGQLMRALHRSGRRADALRVYSEGRRVLAEELGLDPGTELQELERAILLDDPVVDAPPPRPSTGTGRLPSEVTSFVGRAREVRDVTGLVSRSRLVTLTGAGGSGKSRLALRVATTSAASFRDGAWLVELGAVTDPALVPRAVAQVLGVREEPDHDIAAGVAEALRHQQCLVVLDGCEHLLDAVAPFVEHLLRHTDGVRVLATSREMLDVAGEATYLVPTLAVPDPGEDRTIEAVTAYDGVRLFLERASTADPGFRPGDEDAATVAEVCRRLDGLPLALELAAARTDVLTLRHLADRLDRRFELLTGHRTASPRQRTLRATIEWSYDLLDADERMLFERLSVFAGSFTIEGAEAVCAGDGLDAADVFELLARLVRQSLVVRVDSRGTDARYRLLDSLREYGRDRLRLRPDNDQAHGRHASVFLDLAERHCRELRGPHAAQVLEELEAERAELRAALAWLLDTGDGETACRLAVALAPFWDHRCHVTDALLWLERALAIVGDGGDGGPPSRASLWARVEAANFAHKMDDLPRAVVHCDEVLRLLEVVPDDFAEARTLMIRSEVARYENDLDLALQLATRATAVSRRCGDDWNEGEAWRVLTLVESDRGNLAAAGAHAAECLRVYQSSGDVGQIAGAQSLVAAVARDRGRFAEATALFERSLALLQQVGDPYGIGNMWWHLSITAGAQGDFASAGRFAAESLRVFEETGIPRGIAQAYHLLAEAAMGRGDLDEADAHCETALARFRARGFTGDLILALGTVARIRLAQGDPAAALDCCDEALDYAHRMRNRRDTARLLCLRSAVLLAQGDTSDASAAAQEAADLSEEAGDERGAAVASIALADAALAEGRRADARRHLDVAGTRLASADAAFTASEARDFDRIRAAAEPPSDPGP
jgi:predicted ATPase/DNA-binding winged helix-turn-helix (wHTH) protein